MAGYIKEHAIVIDDSRESDEAIYKAMEPYRLIMVGEMHGTNEPAAFVTNLAGVQSGHGDSVQVGLEIPESDMREYLEKGTERSIYESKFFRQGYGDGRSCKAWAEMMWKLAGNKKVKLFFYDVNGQENDIENRDSMLYLYIRKQMIKNPNLKTIILSGNFHNILQAYKKSVGMGLYLKTDSSLNLANKICAIDHRYVIGTMYNDIGKGASLRTINLPESDYSKAIAGDYLLKLPPGRNLSYTMIYFSRVVTASMPTTVK